MKNINVIILMLFVLNWRSSQAQQLPIFNQYKDYFSLINPATINLNYLINDEKYPFEAGLSYRSQWVNKNFGPKTMLANLEYIYYEEGLYSRKGVGLILGGQLISDATGPTSFIGGLGRIGGILKLGDYSGLSLGFNIGFLQHQIKVAELNFIQEGDLADDQNITQSIPELGVGLFYYYNGFRRNYLYTGFSIPQVLEMDLTFRGLNEKRYTIKRLRHYYGILGYVVDVDKEISYIDLSTWIKYVEGAKINMDFIGRIYFGLGHTNSNSFWVGVGVSTSQTAHLGIGTQLEKLRIGYGYDVIFTPYRQYFGGAHEINLGFRFGSKY